VKRKTFQTPHSGLSPNHSPNFTSLPTAACSPQLLPIVGKMVKTIAPWLPTPPLGYLWAVSDILFLQCVPSRPPSFPQKWFRATIYCDPVLSTRTQSSFDDILHATAQDNSIQKPGFQHPYLETRVPRNPPGAGGVAEWWRDVTSFSKRGWGLSTVRFPGKRRIIGPLYQSVW
jgi:hypothetical protein